MLCLEGKVAVITGGGQGIGLATGIRFVQEGAKVLLVDIDEKALKQAVKVIGGDSVSYVKADVTQVEQVKEYVNAAMSRYGGIDVFINNAGIEGEINTIVDGSVENFDRVMAVNVRGVWLGLKYVIPEMQKRGRGSIVITSSAVGVEGMPGHSPYVASKHAIVGLMRSAALECASMNIRVNTVNPGPTETRLIRSIASQLAPDAPDQAAQSIREGNPMKRCGTPEEVANMMLFLASDESSYCTGGVYMVDGGETA